MTVVFYSWNEHSFRSDLISAGLPAGGQGDQFRQDNPPAPLAVFRGLHFQLQNQGSWCAAVWVHLDVAVDLREVPSLAIGWGQS